MALMKQINVKQAQKWLQKLKSDDLQSYKDITKFLRKYEKTQDQYDCFVKINNTLLNYPKLTQELNIFMQQGNKMIIQKSQQQKIKQLMGFMKKNRPLIFNKTINIIQQMSLKNNLNDQQLNIQLLNHLKQVVKDDYQLLKITQQALEGNGTQLIQKLNLDHLKNNNQNINKPQIIDQIQEQPSKINKNNNNIGKYAKKQMQISNNNVLNINNYKNNYNNKEQTIIQQKAPRLIPFTVISSIEDQKYIFKILQKNIDKKTYYQIIKILKIYSLNIITRNQIFQLISSLNLQQQLIQFFKDILETRETDRRKYSVFKPLNDLNFNYCQRISPSYSLMPFSYSNKCAKRQELFKKILNDIYVSVPHGSEENFNVRYKNPNQINLLKSQDQRYQFDLYKMRLVKANQILQTIITKNDLQESNMRHLLNKVISMGIIQLIYKNCSKQQKQQIQWSLKNNTLYTIKILKYRIQVQIKQMQSIKSIHALKVWQDIANKNFTKALDLKGFQYKKNQKQKIKNTYFITQLYQKHTYLLNGQKKSNLIISFQEKKKFFTIFNSFQTSSRNQKCLKRNLPQIKCFNLNDQKKRMFYPCMILAFENKQICKKIYSFILFYIDNFLMTDNQKLRCKWYLEKFLINFLQWQLPSKRYLNELYDEQKLYQKVFNNLQEQINFKSWISQSIQLKNIQYQRQQNLPKFNTLNDQCSSYGYLPQKSQNNKILYGSQQSYALLRFIYTLYERIIKIEQVSQIQQKFTLFQILFYSCIKVKQGMKFQQNLNQIFGKHAYLFSTLYKLFDNMIRTLNLVSGCIAMNQSFRLSKIQNEQTYLLLLNKFYLSNQLFNNKIVRYVYQPQLCVLYINLLDSFYKNSQNNKQVIRKIYQIGNGVDIYTMDSYYGCVSKKKRKLNQILQSNQKEYFFDVSTIKMINHQQKQDLICQANNSNKKDNQKSILCQIQRLRKLNKILI